MKVSVIIPVYNEEKVIGDCLKSLSQQTRKQLEIIIVDDGSTDSSKLKVQSSKPHLKTQNLKLLEQSHKGPGTARNLGARHSKSDIFVFVDSDMTFAPDFIEKLVEPVESGQSKGTFTKEEYVSNWDNVWARCWNYNNGIRTNRRIPENYPETAPVFRAILKSEFDKVHGFTESIGWTDDWSLSQKLGYQATTTLALCYHHNPASFAEIFKQARWIGKNEFLTRDNKRLFVNFVRYSFPASFFTGIFKSLIYQEIRFFVFKLIYDFTVTTSLMDHLFGKTERNK